MSSSSYMDDFNFRSTVYVVSSDDEETSRVSETTSTSTTGSSLRRRNRAEQKARKSASKIRPVNAVPRNPQTYPSDLPSEDIETGEDEYLNEDDDDDTEIINLIEDDEADKIYAKLTSKEMFCEVCDKSMAGQKKEKFIIHHRRHIAPELFRCPTCKRGYTTLSLCLQHEQNEHQRKNKVKHGGTECESAMYNAPWKGLYEASDTSDESMDECDEDKNRVMLSTMFHPYRGPKVTTYAGAIVQEHRHQNKFQNRDFNSEMAKQFSERPALGKPEGF